MNRITSDRLVAIEDTIREACRQAIAKGFRIVRCEDGWFSRKCCCPLGAFDVVARKPIGTIGYNKVFLIPALHCLNIEPLERSSFIDGVDKGITGNEFARMGNRIALEFIK